MNFSKRLKELREERNISQKILANHLKINQSAISKWENNIIEPDLETLIEIAKFFNISVDDLLDYETQKEAQNIINENNITNIYDFIELVKKGTIQLIDEPLTTTKLNTIIEFIEFQLNKKND